jgi:hypothetical protein
MLHLDPERLAELADALPSSDEREHLAGCAACTRELAAQRATLAMAARERAMPLSGALNEWDTLASRLRDEGLIVEHADDLRARRSLWSRPWLRSAAAVLLVAGGFAAGRLAPRAAAGRGADQASLPPVAARPTGGATVMPVSNADSLLTVEDALAVMQKAERDYRTAAAFIVAHDSSYDGRESADRYRARLAALDKVQSAALAAVNELPSDPVVNQYLLSAQTAKEVTLRQLSSTMPPGRLTSW